MWAKPKHFDYMSNDMHEGLKYKSGDFHSVVAFGGFCSSNHNIRETHRILALIQIPILCGMPLCCWLIYLVFQYTFTEHLQCASRIFDLHTLFWADHSFPHFIEIRIEAQRSHPKGKQLVSCGACIRMGISEFITTILGLHSNSSMTQPTQQLSTLWMMDRLGYHSGDTALVVSCLFPFSHLPIHTSIRPPTHPPTHPSIQSSGHPLTYPSAHVPTHPYTHISTHLSTLPLTHSSTPPLT